MAKTYTSTINVKCWKEHACANCGTQYAYQFARKVSGTAGTAAQATVRAEANVKKTLEQAVDQQPCPICGTYQPDMIGQWRAKRMWLVFWLALSAFAIIAIAAAAYGIQANTGVWATAVVCAIAAAALWLIDTRDPNRDPTSNQRLAAERVSAGVVAHQPTAKRPSGPSGRPTNLSAAPAGGSSVRLLVRLLMFAAVALAAGAEALRSSQHWPLNEAAYPPVVGPGDATRVYMEQKIHSIKSYWRGRPMVTIHESEGAGGPNLTADARTNDNNWGSSIAAKSSEKNNTSTPWVEVTMPNDANLSGKHVACDIDLQVEYPETSGSSTFEVTSAQMHRTVDLALAPAGAGARYNAWRWGGTLGAMGVVLVGTLVLISSARTLQRGASPTRCYPLASPSPGPAGGMAPPPLPPAS